MSEETTLTETEAPASNPEATIPETSAPEDPRAVTVRHNLEALLDVELPLIAILAEKTLTLGEVLDLDIDSVIVFPKHNSDPISLHVNNVEVGSGKTIKVGDHFGLHLRSYSPEKVVHSLL